jgi:hypothetical protein
MFILMPLVKIFVIVSIFFVWVVRYSNIVEEFQAYGLPNWFRDFMGIIKLSACLMIIYNQTELVLLAAGILAILMFSAFVVHIKYKHTIMQMIPSFLLMCASFLIAADELMIL